MQQIGAAVLQFNIIQGCLAKVIFPGIICKTYKDVKTEALYEIMKISENTGSVYFRIFKYPASRPESDYVVASCAI